MRTHLLILLLSAFLPEISAANSRLISGFSGLKHIEIGKDPVKGVVSLLDNTLEVKTGGKDIWNRHDEFSIEYMVLKGDFDISVQVVSLTASHSYTKAGIMARADLSDSSQHVYFQVFPDNRPRNNNNGGCEFQYRTKSGETMKAIYPNLKTAADLYNVNYPDTWIRMKRHGDVFLSFFSTDNKNWRQFSTFTLEMPKELYVGLAVTSHQPGVQTTARFKNLEQKMQSGDKRKNGFVCTDYTQGKVMVISAAGKLEWEYPAKFCNDIWVLPGGNLLFNTGTGVKEVNRSKEVIFSYESGSEIYACQRLANGNTFIGECNSGKLLEVDPSGKIIKTVKLLPDSVDGGNTFMRNARKLENDNYLVAHYGLDKVCEYNPDGILVRTIPAAGGPHSVIRLDNGNTLIACGDHNNEAQVFETDPAGNIIWRLTKNELPDIELKFMSGMQYLPNGNLVLTNWLGHNQFGTSPHAFEITRDKKVVWTYNDNTYVKTISNIVMLK